MVVLLLVDSLWVVGARKLHQDTIEKVQKSPMKVDYVPALMFYLMVPLGYVFIVKKLSKTRKDAFLYGMLLGLLMYGTFDLTNKAVFKEYPWSYTIADMAWGTLCVGIVSAVVFSLENNHLIIEANK